MEILIENFSGKAGPPGYRESIKRLTRKAVRLKIVPPPKKSVNVVLVANEAIQEANRMFRKKNKPTDVLSFRNEDTGVLDDASLGDIMIALAVARRQAKENELPLRAEIARLYVHGLLHLCGHDHKTTRGAAAMNALQERLLSGVV